MIQHRLPNFNFSQITCLNSLSNILAWSSHLHAFRSSSNVATSVDSKPQSENAAALSLEVAVYSLAWVWLQGGFRVEGRGVTCVFFLGSLVSFFWGSLVSFLLVRKQQS